MRTPGQVGFTSTFHGLHSLASRYDGLYNPKSCMRTHRAVASRSPSPSMVFTGIVEEMGTVDSILNLDSADGGVTMAVSCSTACEDAKLGDSIAINGTCLSITEMTNTSLSFGLVPETLSRTNLGQLSIGQQVNLERSMSASGRFGGHVVQGHVDCTGTVIEVRPDKDALWFTIQIPKRFMRYIVEKGYITVDGASLTVVDILDDAFTFTMIPITQSSVVTAKKKPGDLVNIEVDITAKYIERMLSCREGSPVAMSSSKD